MNLVDPPSSKAAARAARIFTLRELAADLNARADVLEAMPLDREVLGEG
jgi:hypothetical protein